SATARIDAISQNSSWLASVKSASLIVVAGPVNSLNSLPPRRDEPARPTLPVARERTRPVARESRSRGRRERGNLSLFDTSAAVLVIYSRDRFAALGDD